MLYNFHKAVVKLNRIKEMRISVGMTQTDLAQQLNISRTAVSKYELGQLDMGTSTICALCDIFGCSADYLLGRAALPSSGLSSEEEELLLAWRAATPEIRAIIDAALSPYRKKSSSSAV